MKIEIETHRWFIANANRFSEWFNEDELDWWCCSRYLAQYCSEHFMEWWNKDKFNWESNRHLAKYCIDYIDIWYDPSKFKESKEDLKWNAIK